MSRSFRCREQVAMLHDLLRCCTLCPRQCRVDRTRGERGFCRLGAEMVMDRALPHYGEEPPLSGRGGAGTIFFSSCNLKCSYCQNYQISHDIRGERPDCLALAEIMLSLAARGCHNIEPVTPTPQTPQIMAAFLAAREQGLTLPLVYNCGGYEAVEVVALLEGMVDIYLPDFKYGSGEAGLLFSGVPDYPTHAAAALREMVRQVGDDLELDGEVATRGVLIRHLVLPGNVENSFAALRIIQENTTTRVPLSIMSQYSPIPAVEGHAVLGRRVSRQEYEAVVNFALDLGFETIFTQEVSDQSLSPDFAKETPFDW